ncbi:MAG TPA: sigma-70 family RNA polymerase sigma factor [Ktedonobacterales bacterium]|nr:sigma-70 family RNA polymerase sigma factor [Ktedonobacterales bacterium]
MALPVKDNREMEQDERALVAAAQADPQAFAALYARFAARVYRYIRAHVPTDDEAADLSQQVFLRALDALPAYHERGAPFAAWLFQIARRVVIDAARRRRPTIAWEALPAHLHPEAEGSNPETAVLRDETLTRLRVLVAKLDAEKRELLALRFAGQLSAPEIAAVVGKSPEAVKRQLTRIVHALKEQFHGEE